MQQPFITISTTSSLWSPLCKGPQLLNAAKGVSQGFEMDMHAVPMRNLTISASVGHLNSGFTNFPNASFYAASAVGDGQLVSCTCDATGNQFVIAPKWTANITPRYKLPTAVGDFTFTVSDYFNDGFFFDAQNSLRQPLYRLLNANVAHDPHWRVE